MHTPPVAATAAASTGEPGHAGHLARIDVLRGVAILAVVAFHAYGAAFGRDAVDWPAVLAGADPRPSASFLLFYPLHFGSTGVAMFFVISGYLIHRSYLRAAGQFAWGDYAARRFWRIYPAYLVALVAFAALGRSAGPRDLALHAALAHNVSARTFYGINPAFWSLAVEAQLYALYPLAALARRAWGAGGMLALGVVASAVWRLAAAATVGWPDADTIHVWASPVALWPEWLLGAYLADRHHAGGRAFGRPVAWAAAATALLLVGEAWEPLAALQSSFAAVGYAVLLEAYVARGGGGDGRLGATARALAFVGVCSYSLYLIHQPLMRPFARLLAGAGLRWPPAQLLVGFPLYVAAVVACAWAMYHTIERGGLRIGRRFGRSRARRHAPHPDPAPVVGGIDAADRAS